MTVRGLYRGRGEPAAGFARGVTCFTMRNLWSAAWRTLRCAKHASRPLGGVRRDRSHVRVYSLYGLGFGSDVTIVVGLDERPV